jgi:hypothetical protein
VPRLLQWGVSASSHVLCLQQRQCSWISTWRKPLLRSAGSTLLTLQQKHGYNAQLTGLSLGVPGQTGQLTGGDETAPTPLWQSTFYLEGNGVTGLHIWSGGAGTVVVT